MNWLPITVSVLFAFTLPHNIEAQNCSNLDLSLCAQMSATPVYLTESECGRSCNIIDCCVWPDLNITYDYGPYIDNQLNNGTFSLTIGGYKVPSAKDIVTGAGSVISSIDKCTINYNTNECLKKIGEARDSLCKQISQEVCDAAQKMVNVVVAGITIQNYPACVSFIAGGYITLDNVLPAMAAKNGITPVSVDPQLLAQIDCLYDCGAARKAKIYFGGDKIKLPCGPLCAQTFGDNIFMPSFCKDYKSLTTDLRCRTTLFHELTHVKQYECEAPGDRAKFGVLYGNSICARIALGDRVDTDIGSSPAYKNSKYEKEAYAKEDEVPIDLLNNKCTKSSTSCIPAAYTLIGYGCNRVDDNCDGFIDDCLEDQTAPTILVSENSIGSKCFSKQTDAETFFQTNTFTQDDCQAQPFTTVTTQDFVKKCTASTMTIKAVDNCNNAAFDQIMFTYDEQVPTLTVDQPKIDDKGCFTDQEVAENFILTNSKTTDDCTATNLIDLSISSFVKDCKNSKATVKAVDLCENVKTVDAKLNFDDGKPLVKINPLADTCYTSSKDLEAAIKDKTTLKDDCTKKEDLKVFTSINEQCEESTATVYATDECGNVGSGMVKFNFDNKPPEILVSEYSLGSKWLTNADYAKLFFLTNTFTTDDCSSQAETLVTFTNLVKNCAASTAVITANDKCGNTAVDPIMFLYDDDRPTVAVTLAKSNFILSEDKIKKGLVDVGLTIAATDDCTLNPNVTVLIYSDELYDKAVDDWTARTVQLSRIETVPGVITGWKLLVAVEAFKVCNYGPYFCGGTTKVEGDGRVYTIQVCATDEAGNRYCVEKTVSVGLKDANAISGGKMYLLAEDSISKFRTL